MLLPADGADKSRSDEQEQPEYSHDRLTEMPSPADAAVRLTRTHGCFAIDGLPRPEVADGQRDAYYDQRELAFEPGPALRPEAALLSAADRRQYDESGFIVCAPPILTAAEVRYHAALWEACHSEEAAVREDGAAAAAPPPGDAVNGYFKKYRGCLDLVAHARVVQLARDVLGPNIACWGGHYISKPPETDVAIQCHQDGWYW